MYRVKLVEDMHGLKRIVVLKEYLVVSETGDMDSYGDDDTWDSSDEEEDNEIWDINSQICKKSNHDGDFPCSLSKVNSVENVNKIGHVGEGMDLGVVTTQF